MVTRKIHESDWFSTSLEIRVVAGSTVSTCACFRPSCRTPMDNTNTHAFWNTLFVMAHVHVVRMPRVDRSPVIVVIVRPACMYSDEIAERIDWTTTGNRKPPNRNRPARVVDCDLSSEPTSTMTYGTYHECIPHIVFLNVLFEFALVPLRPADPDYGAQRPIAGDTRRRTILRSYLSFDRAGPEYDRSVAGRTPSTTIYAHVCAYTYTYTYIPASFVHINRT